MKLNYKRTGEGEPLVILHGLLGMLDNWMSHARALERTYDVIVVDARNHGRSPWDNTFDYEVMAADLEELLDDLFLSEVNLLGHSMGGKTVMKFAQNHPDWVQKLIIADIGPKSYPIQHERILRGLQSVPLDRLEKRSDAEGYLADHIEEPGVRQFLMKSLYRNETKSFAWRFNLEVIERNIGRVGETILDRPFDGPTLFVRGSESNYIRPEDEEGIHLVFPQATIETIPRAGHWLHADQPEIFLEIIRSFLDD